ncbi:ATP synthase F1 subunit delta [Clostridiaceae bacterium HSG29]|nr:ATP synthase F1 subunit delta [Clostridiaceae bacterium HSG29]
MAKLIGSTYANSLFEVAAEMDVLDNVSKELNFVTETFKTQKDFYQFFISPKVSKTKRKEVIGNVYKDRLSNEVYNFLKLLIDKDRATEIFSIKLFFDALLDKNRNVKRVVVESVMELTDEHKRKLIEKLSKSTNSEIILKNIVRPEILGGIILRIDNEVIDDSVLSKLDSIGDSITKIII